MRLPRATVVQPRVAWRPEGVSPGERVLPEETPVALSYNRTSHAVMMATPQDLEDFALGFSLNERIVERANDIEEMEIVLPPGADADGAALQASGIEIRLWISNALMSRLETRRRRLAGATGCGMCGLESLEEAMRPPESVPPGLRLGAAALQHACAALRPAQALNDVTRAVHAAGFWTPGAGLVAVREDVGRHNALDKLAGVLARDGHDAAHGVLLMTSRVSVELVQKAARMGVSILAAVSAPTALAVRSAERAGITLVAVARQDGFELYTRPDRIDLYS